MGISLKTHKMLWGRAAYRCAFPGCCRELVMDASETDDASLIGDECHIVAREQNGPRGNSSLSPKARDKYDNLILLCKIHHKLVDDQPDTYNIQALKKMKFSHEKWVHESLQSLDPAKQQDDELYATLMNEYAVEASLSSTIQEREKHHQATSSGGIQANRIEANNVVVGVQQIIQQPRQYLPPLYRPPRVLHFVDREDERAWLLDHLRPGRVVTLCGPGGMGKTALVAEVLWHLAPGNSVPDDFPDGIFFYSFYGQAEVAMALEHLARTFGEEPLPSPALAAQRALSRRCPLLVFDGAEEADHLERILKVCANCAILVTSRRRIDAVDLEYLQLHPLQREQAVAVVQAWREEQVADESTIRHICELVGDLPLALRLVGRYLARHGEEASEYLRLFQETPWAALQERQSQHDSVRILLDHSITKLSEAARRVLVVIGLLAPAAFDRDILAQVLNCSDTAARQALNELLEYGLVLHTKKRYEVSHALIHTYARKVLLATDDLASQRELSKYLIQVLDKWLSSTVQISKASYEQALPHVQACLSLIDQYELFLPEAARLLSRAGAYLFEQVRYTEAELFYQRALAIREQVLGLEHPFRVASLNNLAALYRKQGKYELAEALYQRAPTIREQELGPKHPLTATSLNNLAELYRDQSKYELAEPLYQRALAICEQVLGLEHPSTKRVQDNYIALLLTMKHTR